MFTIIQTIKTNINNFKRLFTTDYKITNNKINLLAMLTLNNTLFRNDNEYLQHLVGISFISKYNYLDMVRSPDFETRLNFYENWDINLLIFHVVKNEISQYVEAVGEPDENNNAKILINHLNFEQMVKDPLFSNTFQTVNDVATRPKNYNTLFYFEDYTWEELQNEFKLYKIGLSAGFNTRRHLLSPLEHKLAIYLISLGFPIEEVFKSFLDIQSITDSRKGGHFYNFNAKNQRLNLSEKLPKVNLPFPLVIYNQNKNNINIHNNLKTVNVNQGTDKINEKELNNKINEKELNNKIIEKTPKNEKKNKTLRISGPRINKENNNLLEKKIPLYIKKINSTGKRKFSTSAIVLSKSSTKSSKKVIQKKEIKGERTKLIIKEKKKNINSKESILNLFENSQNISKNNVLTFLDKIESLSINNSESNKIDIQTKLESNFVDIIKDKLTDSNLIKHRLSKSIYKAFDSLKTFLLNRRKYKKDLPLIKDYLLKIENMIITFSIIITYHSKFGYTFITGRIGNALLYNIYKLYIKDSIKNNETILSFKEFYDLNKFDEEKIINLGNIFVTRFVEIGFIDIKMTYDDDNNKNWIVINKDYTQLIVDNLIISPPSLPMLCPPLKWDDTNTGGFLSNKEDRIDIISGSVNQNFHKIENRENLYNAINYINNIKFGVNNDLLNYLLGDGKFLIDAEERELLAKKDESTKLHILLTLKLAKLYSNISFYLNTSADWRGRIYTKSFFLSYQSNDLSNALVQFWDGEILTQSGFDNFYIFGANCFGEGNINKLPYKDRIQWVYNNYKNILNMAPDFILKADSKFLFTSFCLNMRKLHENRLTKINTPIFLDATCSGIQHLAALIKDLELGSRVNLIPQSENDEVGDIYSYIVNPINKELNKLAKENIDFSHFDKIELTRSIIKWNIMTITYHITVYGGSKQLENKLEKIEIINTNKEEILKLLNSSIYPSYLTIASNLEKNLEKNINNKTKVILYKAPANNKIGYVLLSKKDLFEIAKVINDQVFYLYPSLRKVYDYLVEISKILIKLNIPITWFTPSGLLITQHYLKTEVKNCSFKIGGNTRTMVIKKTNKNKTATSKQVQAIIPNIIHSLDASHLINLLNTAINKNFTPIISVHDCFGTHPNKMDELNFLVKKEFILLYTKDNFLTKFHERILSSIKDNNIEIFENEDNNFEYKNYFKLNNKKIIIPNVPTQGILNLEDIIYSRYIIT